MSSIVCARLFLGELDGIQLIDGCLTVKRADGILRIQLTEDIRTLALSPPRAYLFKKIINLS